MAKIKIVENYDDNLLKYAIIITRSQEQWVLCKHKDRDTYEFPAGHREEGENILETAKRELYEETGAVDYILEKVCAITSSTIDNGIEKEAGFYSMVFYAEIKEFGELPNFEMEKIEFFDEVPNNLTYVDVQTRVVDIVIARGVIGA